MRICGTSICASGRTALRPGVAAATVATSAASPRNEARSGPITLMTTGAVSPERVSSMRSLKKLSIANPTPGTRPIRVATSRTISSTSR